MSAVLLHDGPGEITAEAVYREGGAFVFEDAVFEPGEVGDHQWQSPTFDIAGLLWPVEYLPGSDLEMGDETDVGYYTYGCVAVCQYVFTRCGESHEICHCVLPSVSYWFSKPCLRERRMLQSYPDSWLVARCFLLDEDNSGYANSIDIGLFSLLSA